MRLEELFSDDLYTEYALQSRYTDAVNLLNEFNSKSESERLEELIQIWSTWSNGEGKAEFLLLAGMDMTRARDVLSGSNPLRFEDYIRFKAVGKDYAVLAQKYKQDGETHQIKTRLRYLKNKNKQSLN